MIRQRHAPAFDRRFKTAERIGFESHGHMVGHNAAQRISTRRLLKGILGVEQEHARELADLLVHA